jgi:hypothetical protein
MTDVPDDVIIVPFETVYVFLAKEERTIVAPGEVRVIAVPDESRVIKVGSMTLLASKKHTEGDTRLWTVDYENWLDNTAMIESIDVQSSSSTCTVSSDPTITGPVITFHLTGGTLNERFTISLVMADSFGNVKHDTIAFMVVAA